jgi:hypothetical protein
LQYLRFKKKKTLNPACEVGLPLKEAPSGKGDFPNQMLSLTIKRDQGQAK